MTRKSGFTLVELMVVVGVLSVLSTFVFAAVDISLDSSRLASTETRIQNNVRDTFPVMCRELELAARATTAAGVNGLTGIRVLRDGVAQDPNIWGDMVVFQTPLDNTGLNWSTPVQYRFINEDKNENGFLDAGEDTINDKDPKQDGNGDGMLTRCVVREQDLNGDGAFDDAGERRIVGGVNELQTVRFTLNATGDMLTVTIGSSQPLEGGGHIVTEKNGQGQMVSRIESQALAAEATTQVYIYN